MSTLDWTDKLDQLIFDSFKEGRVTGCIKGIPDKCTESGLAHIFFYGDTVYKLYKTHSDKDDFIKGVLAPTVKRKHFVEHDFRLNKYFSNGIYRNMYSVYYTDEKVDIAPYDGSSIYVLYEMEHLDFKYNLHEQLLQNDINEGDLYQLGYQTAKSVSECEVEVPDGLCWYNLASERMVFLKKFVDWMPEKYQDEVVQSECLDALDQHLQENKIKYKKIVGSHLSVNLDNHDENIFIRGGKPHFIDILPPMSCWWYGVPHVNLCNIMVNIEVLHSKEAADKVKRGYFDYHQVFEFSEDDLAFAKAFSYMISIAHFGSLPNKKDVADKYLKQCKNIPKWLTK